MTEQDFLKRLTVLYIEDNESISLELCKVLNRLFGQVYFFDNAEDALECFEKHQGKESACDLIISDIQMPNMDGIELLEEIRDRDKQVPFLITTAYTQSEYLMPAIKLGVSDYLTKPINFKDFTNKILKACYPIYSKWLRKDAIKARDELITVIDQVALVCRTKTNGEILFVNELFCKILEYTYDELVGQTHHLFKDPSTENNLFHKIYQTGLNGKKWEGKLKNVSKSGEELYTQLTVFPIYSESDEEIIELMWIAFLTTQEEKEQKDFKKNVVQNVQETRRVNLESRKKIDDLEKALLKYKHFDLIEYSLEVEKKRTAKSKHQIKYYEDQMKVQQKKFDDMNAAVEKRLEKSRLFLQKEKEKKEKALSDIRELKEKFFEKKERIQVLNESLKSQTNEIQTLTASIEQVENNMNL